MALAHALPDFMGEFVKNRFNFKKATEDAGSEAVQIAFFAAFLHIVDRHPCREGATPLAQCTWIQKDAARQENWAKWEKIVAASQARLDGVPEALAGDRDALRLPAHADLDGSVFEIAKDRRMPPASAISSLERHVPSRLWHPQRPAEDAQLPGCGARHRAVAPPAEVLHARQVHLSSTSTRTADGVPILVYAADRARPAT